MLYWRFKYFLQLKAAEGAQYSTEQAIKLEMELVELKAERTVMSLRVSEGFLGKKKPQGRIPTPFPPQFLSGPPVAVRPFQREPVNRLRLSMF